LLDKDCGARLWSRRRALREAVTGGRDVSTLSVALTGSPKKFESEELAQQGFAIFIARLWLVKVPPCRHQLFLVSFLAN